LTPNRKQEISALLAPYCRTPGDILGREDLNNLLGCYPEVERSNFKLWLTSEAVLTRVLQAGVWGDTGLALERIRQRASRYVVNPSFERAKEILKNHHYCIVAGIPGIGKTTLAEILLVEYVDRQEFQAVRIANDLSEIKAVKNLKRRQIFYFDDFLGTTGLDKLQKNEDRRLMEFIEETKTNKNWRFILTTREYILNAAKIRYEALAHPPVDLAPCIIELADYTRPIRAKILYNHIFFSDLSDAYKRALLENGRYQEILEHRNYNPRIIEHMTQARHIVDISVEGYFDSFMDNLTNPKRIWDHAFRNQLGEPAQHALIVMGSLPEQILIEDLELAFESFYQYRREKIGFSTSSRDFERALKSLDGNFVKINLLGEKRVVTFHNPSISDFIENYLAESPDDVADLVESSVFIDQFARLWRGQGGKRFSGISRCVAKFVDALARQLLAPTCNFIQACSRGGGISGVHIWGWSFERRAKFAHEVASGLSAPESQALMDKVLDTLQKRLEAGSGEKDDLVRFLRAVSPEEWESDKYRAIFAAAKGYLSRELHDIDDFTSLGNFIESFPTAFTEAELVPIRVEFADLSRDYDDSWAEDSEDLRSLADKFERAGAQLTVDVEDVCEQFLSMAEERDRPEPDDYDFDREDSGWGRQNVSSSEPIEGMFDGLLREIDERQR
jgi:hypothetical protein